jgi:putative ABC transport system permease protein
MKLAWRNLSHDRLRFLVTVLGIAFATFLMVFQGSLLYGFVQAAGRIINASGADIWIAARGVTCFDFGAPVPSRYRDLAMGVEGVREVKRIVTAFTLWQRPSGERQTILLIGADAGVGENFPAPLLRAGDHAMLPDAVLVDESNMKTLGIEIFPTEVEINGRRARVLRSVSGFSSFMGSPFVFTSYRDGMRYARLPPEETMYLLVKTQPGANVETVKNDLARRLHDVDVYTREEFATRAATYWIVQTGAGGALLTAAALGFIIGVVIVSQTIYATTMEHLEEFATLKALGASRWFIYRVVLTQAIISGVLGSAIGVALVYPAAGAARATIAWIQTPWQLPLAMVAVSLLMCALAAVVSIRAAVAVEPGRVFRA